MKFSVLLASLLFVSQMVFAQEKPSEQLYQEAYENFVKRDYPAASQSLDKINPVDQKKPDVLNLRGAIYKRLGELDNAANAYSDALKINPKDWVPKYNLAEVNFLREQYKSSRTFLEQALASMPESDRLQKQDLILYKVYLTYLMQNDEEKAKLLLDSFDINSANPVYYFAQAAWSFKKKDAAKAKTWVSSTEGLYSQDLRNSYGQALVDIGWLEPSAGIGSAAMSANPAATASPIEVAVAITPTPAPESASTIVPLATNNATPITVTEPTIAPTPTEVPTASPVSSIPDLAVATEKKPEEEKQAPYKLWIAILAVVGVAGIILIQLAKRSKIVPPPEDNTGYAAIQASASPANSGAIGHSSEGTGAVLEQDIHGDVAPASIRLSPILRDYSDPTPAQAAPASSVIPLAGSIASRKSTGRAKPSPKLVATAKSKTAAPIKKLIVAKQAPAAAPIVKVAAKKAIKEPVKLPSKAPAVAVTVAPSKPTTSKTPSVAKTAVTPVIEAAPTVSLPAKAPVTRKTAAKTSIKKPVTPTPAVETRPTASKRSRLVAIPTINVPAPEVPPPKLMVSNIEILKADPTKVEPPAQKPATKSAPKAKAPAKPTVAKAKPGAKTPAAKNTAPLIMIPEFEDNALDTTPAPVIRLIPEDTSRSTTSPLTESPETETSTPKKAPTENPPDQA